MTRIDFYLVAGETDRNSEILACRLAEKAYKQGRRIRIQTRDAEQSLKLDELLWTFAQGSFVPHTRDSEDQQSPILIDSDNTNDWEYDVLVNLSDETPSGVEHCQRVAEIIGEKPERRALARDRFRQYRESGAELHSHNV